MALEMTMQSSLQVLGQMRGEMKDPFRSMVLWQAQCCSTSAGPRVSKEIFGPRLPAAAAWVSPCRALVFSYRTWMVVVPPPEESRLKCMFCTVWCDSSVHRDSWKGCSCNWDQSPSFWDGLGALCLQTSFFLRLFRDSSR